MPLKFCCPLAPNLLNPSPTPALPVPLFLITHHPSLITFPKSEHTDNSIVTQNTSNGARMKPAQKRPTPQNRRNSPSKFIKIAIFQQISNNLREELLQRR
jgi:hypothetical protein